MTKISTVPLRSIELSLGNRAGTNGHLIGNTWEVMARNINSLPCGPCLGKGEAESSNLSGSTINFKDLAGISPDLGSDASVHMNAARLPSCAVRPLPPEDLARLWFSQKSAVFRQSTHPMFTVRPPRSGTVAERGCQMTDKGGE